MLSRQDKGLFSQSPPHVHHMEWGLMRRGVISGVSPEGQHGSPPTMAALPVLLPPCNLGSDSLLLWRETLLVA